MIELTIVLCIETLGFQLKRPTLDNPRTSLDHVQLRKFLITRKDEDIYPLIDRIIQLEEKSCLSRLIQLGLPRGNGVSSRIITSSIIAGKYAVLLEANKIRLIGRADILRSALPVPKQILSIMRVEEKLPCFDMSLVVILRLTNLANNTTNVFYNSEVIGKFVRDKNTEVWKEGDRYQLFQKCVEYRYLDVFEHFYNLFGKEALNVDILEICKRSNAVEIARFLENEK